MTPLFDGTIRDGRLLLDTSDKFKQYLIYPKRQADSVNCEEAEE
jgi:hypothetical protein